MSWLRYNDTGGQIALYPGGNPGNYVAAQVGLWPAHNQATKSSKGPWPKGTWKWSHYNAHAEAGAAPVCNATAYGCFGIHVFQVPNRPGIGVHAGRTKGEPLALGGKTLGCIRVPVAAMESINALHQTDKLQAIVVS